ncbi:MAG: glycoside hydrolase family 13 protein [Fuerstiella sp.]|nr:glycoside hydrolase family 13 protein [Fuerstiella sp.]
MPIDTPDWVRDAVFYQIFPDRFARSGRITSVNHLEPWDVAPTPFGFKGGDLYGVAQKLDYLQDLGVTAIYFCPIFSSAANHRYHTYDYYNVDPLLGGNEALRELLDDAHERGLKVVLDGVFNHASRGFWQFHHVLENGAASPFKDWFHFDQDRLEGHKPFQAYPSDDAAHSLANGQGSYEAIGYGAWWNLPALPKFNTDCPEVREFLWAVAEYWVEFGIDGWRLDVANEIEDDEFWREFRRRVRAVNPDAYIVGEVWGEAQHWLYGDMWDAVMNYQVTAACLGFFGGDHLDLDEVRRASSFSHVQRCNGPEFAAEIQRVGSIYPQEITAAQLNLLDSHDMPRFLTCCKGDRAALKMAWLFLCLIPGAPCIYYGDEIGLDGRHDPDCRKAFPWQRDGWDMELYDWYQACIRIRSRYQLGRAEQPRVVVAKSSTVVFRIATAAGSLFGAFNAGSVEVNVELPANASGDVSVVLAGAAMLGPDHIGGGLLRLVIPPRCGALLASDGICE